MDSEGNSPGEASQFLFYKGPPEQRAIGTKIEVELKMQPICDSCGTRKVPVEENAFACPKCEPGTHEIPRACDYCHAHVASTPADGGKWICDPCIIRAIAATEETPVSRDASTGPEVNAHAS